MDTSTEATNIGAHTPQMPPSNHSQLLFTTYVGTISLHTEATNYKVRLTTIIFASMTLWIQVEYKLKQPRKLQGIV